MQEYINYWKNYVNFSDRTTRRGYWMAFLMNFAVSAVISAIAGLLHLGILSTLFALANLLPGLGIFVRRMHDTGRSWAWIFIGLVPAVGAIVLLVFLCQGSAPCDDGSVQV